MDRFVVRKPSQPAKAARQPPSSATQTKKESKPPARESFSVLDAFVTSLEPSKDTDRQSREVRAKLKSAFGLAEFRGLQREIIMSTLQGSDTLVLMPTGGGKSLTYQLPALISPGITLVVSPLIALIQNQVDALLKLKIKAATLNSSLKKSEKDRVAKDLATGKPKTKLLYVTPELLATTVFRNVMKKIHAAGMFSRLVIDEAHCISEWGHDFRDDYRKLSHWRETYLGVPVMALTATATSSVRNDIIRQLHLDPAKLKVFVTSFDRPNLHYEVRFKPADTNDPFNDVLSFLNTVYETRKKRLAKVGSDERSTGICGIIYCSTRKMCDEVARMLRLHSVRAQSYHAGLTAKMRQLILEAWTGTDARTVVKIAAVSMTAGAESSRGVPPPTCSTVHATGNSASANMDLDAVDVMMDVANPPTTVASTDASTVALPSTLMQPDGITDPLSTTPSIDNDFSSNPVRGQAIDIVVATISFGMGIDKRNVRFVIHWDMPKSYESYYQESGRAGRDGKVSRCILYYSRQDRDRHAYLLQQQFANQTSARQKHAMESFNELVKYCENDSECRHRLFEAYFSGECASLPSSSTSSSLDARKAPPAATKRAAQPVGSAPCKDKRCDVCKNPEKVKKTVRDALKEYDCVANGGGSRRWANAGDDDDSIPLASAGHALEGFRTGRELVKEAADMVARSDEAARYSIAVGSNGGTIRFRDGSFATKLSRKRTLDMYSTDPEMDARAAEAASSMMPAQRWSRRRRKGSADYDDDDGEDEDDGMYGASECDDDDDDEGRDARETRGGMAVAALPGFRTASGKPIMDSAAARRMFLFGKRPAAGGGSGGRRR